MGLVGKHGRSVTAVKCARATETCCPQGRVGIAIRRRKRSCQGRIVGCGHCKHRWKNGGHEGAIRAFRRSTSTSCATLSIFSTTNPSVWCSGTALRKLRPPWPRGGEGILLASAEQVWRRGIVRRAYRPIKHNRARGTRQPLPVERPQDQVVSPCHGVPPLRHAPSKTPRHLFPHDQVDSSKSAHRGLAGHRLGSQPR